MPKQFKVSKKLTLEFLGDGWEDCYINFRPFTIEDLKTIEGLQPKEGDEVNNMEQAEKVFALLQERFIDGKALTDEGIVDIEADDIPAFPVELIGRATTLLAGTPSPN